MPPINKQSRIPYYFQLAETLRQQIKDAAASGRVGVDAEVRDRCIAAMSEWPCSGTFTADMFEDADCQELFVGAQAEGDECFSNVECADGTGHGM